MKPGNPDLGVKLVRKVRCANLDLNQLRNDLVQMLEAASEGPEAKSSGAVITISRAELKRVVREAVDEAIVPRSYPRCLPLSQLAKRLDKHPSTVRAWARQNLHGFQLAGRAGRELIIRLPEGLCL